MPWPTPAVTPALDLAAPPVAIVGALPVGPLVALVVALVVAATTSPVLRALPEPEPTDPDKVPYARLAGPGMTLATAGVALAASGVVVATLPPTHWPAWLALAGVSVLACAIDARTTWLPLPLARAGWLVAAAGAGVVAAASGSWVPLVAAALGSLALGGLFHLLWRFTGAFGYGDVRLAATIGAVTALDSVTLVAWSLLLGTLAGALIGVGHRVRGRTGAFPYGPGLLAGPFLALVLRAVTG